MRDAEIRVYNQDYESDSDQPHRDDLAQRAAELLDRVWLRALTAPIAWN